jgi:hypothetical protein
VARFDPQGPSERLAHQQAVCDVADCQARDDALQDPA